MRAKIKVECKIPEMVLKSIKPDISESPKFAVDMFAVEDGVELVVESSDISGLMAGINGYLKLIKASIEVLTLN